jgi:methionine-rich copper-binding protein CopC
MRLRYSILPVAAMFLAAALPATAATPESGTVSASSPTVKWEGEAAGYGVFPTNLLLTTAGQEPAPCEAPYCDVFALKVADKADLNLIAAQRAANNFTEMHVVKPDGEKLFAQSGTGDAVRIKIKGAAPGDYTIEVMTNESVDEGGKYDASATLGAATGQPGSSAPPADPAPSPLTPRPSEPSSGSGPGASPEPAATLGLKTKAVSAKKKKLKLAVTSSKPVKNLKLVIKKGKKVVAKGGLKSLASKGTVKLKLKKKLKKGSYVVAMTADDGGRAVGLTTKLKVKR